MRIEEVIGENLRRARESRGQSQTEFGEWIGAALGGTWKPQTVSAAEKGKRQFIAADLVGLAHVLGVPVAELLTPPGEVETVSAGHLEIPGHALARVADVGPVDGARLAQQLRAMARACARLNEVSGDVEAALEDVKRVGFQQWALVERAQHTLAGEEAPMFTPTGRASDQHMQAILEEAAALEAAAAEDNDDKSDDREG